MEGNGYVLKLKRGNDEPQHVYIDRSYFVLRNLDNYDLKYLENMSWLYHAVKYLKCDYNTQLMEKVISLAKNADLEIFN